MRRTALTAGLLLFLAGFAVMQQGPQALIPIARAFGLASQTQVDRSLIAPTLLTVPAQNYTYLSIDLQTGADVRGSLQVAGAREASFYVMDEGNFTMWRSGHASAVVVAKPVVISYNFTFTAKSSGAYYFIFENQDTTRRTLVFALNVVEHEIVLNPLVAFADYELILLGAALVIIGIRTGGRRGAKPNGESRPVIKESALCRFCGAELENDKVFCEKCGRAQK